MDTEKYLFHKYNLSHDQLSEETTCTTVMTNTTMLLVWVYLHEKPISQFVCFLVLTTII